VRIARSSIDRIESLSDRAIFQHHIRRGVFKKSLHKRIEMSGESAVEHKLRLTLDYHKYSFHFTLVKDRAKDENREECRRCSIKIYSQLNISFCFQRYLEIKSAEQKD